MTLSFIVNGEEAIVEADVGTSIRSAMRGALFATRNTARPPSDWELRFESGTLIADLDDDVSTIAGRSCHFYLTLGLGVGGAGTDDDDAQDSTCRRRCG